ncbi:hypothetical protein WP12_04465 [Sphingomonas sp. SRS2]|nr:hypothetical protein WP12_04465 [Sphingomonas sp. SRS2]
MDAAEREPRPALIDLTFVICTKDRREPLLRCLGSIVTAALRSPQMATEIVVVDNGSTDDTARAVGEFMSVADVPTQMLYERTPGLAAARNSGIAAARGRLIAFTDDDCIVKPDYVADLATHWSKAPFDILRGGRVELGDTRDLPFTIKTSDHVERYSAGDFPGGFLHGCNFVTSRRVLDMVGGFDQRFGAGADLKSAEDTDFLLRGFFAGFPVQYVPNMAIQHFHGRRSASQIEPVILGYSFGNGAIFAKHWRRAPWLLKFPYWTLRAAGRQQFRGARYVIPYGISEWRLFKANVVGAVAYWRTAMRRTQDSTIPRTSLLRGEPLPSVPSE